MLCENLLLQCICAFLLIQLSISANFPSDITKCDYEDAECIAKIGNYVLHSFKTGHKGLNFVSLEPLHIDAIDINEGTEGPVNIELNFRDINLYKLTDGVIYNVSGFGKDIKTSKYEFHIKTPSIYIDSKYKIAGRVLILPIQGNGKSNLTLANLDATIRFTGKPAIVNGKEYLQIDDYKFKFTTTRLYMDFENLFNGDKLLSDNTNLFLNENWSDIFKEIKKSIFKGFGDNIRVAISNIFAKIPYKDFFKE